MSNKFDQLAQSVAQSVTRRQALGRLGLGLVGIAVASLGLAKSEAAHCYGTGKVCTVDGSNGKYCSDCCGGYDCVDGGSRCVCC
jgi:hypothetical protein